MNWKEIRLELAKSQALPLGSVARAYIVKLPLDAGGIVDAQAMADNPRRATVRRFWPSEPDQWGYAVAESGKFRLFSGSHRRYLIFPGTKLVEDARALISTLEGECEEFRVKSIKSV